MKNTLLYIWQLPQHLLGLLLIAFYRPSRKHVLDNGSIVFYAYRMIGGISLGKYSIVNGSHYRENMQDSLKRDTVRHEAIGHARQRCILAGCTCLSWDCQASCGLPCTAGSFHAPKMDITSFGLKNGLTGLEE